MQLNPSIQGRLTRIADGNVGRPLLSGDGKTVVYTRWSGDNWDIERNRDGEMEAVSKHPYHDTSPAMSESGDVGVWSRLTPSTPDGPGSWDLYRWENGETTALAQSSADESEATVTSDGRTVVYTYDDINKTTGYDLHICKDGRCEELTNGGPVDRLPQISGDGQRVVFRRRVRFDGGDLYLKDETGTIKPLTANPLAEFTPTLSRDGKVLAWSQSESRDSDSDIYLYNLANGQKEIIGEDGVEERDPALTPDGSLLAYTRMGEGKSTIQLRQNGKTVPLTIDGSSGFPSLSSDGRTIAWRAVDPADSSQAVIYKFERTD